MTRVRAISRRYRMSWARPRSRIHVGGPNIAAEATADQTSLISKYPGAIDTAPTITDDSTVLSSLWQNFATLLLESIEGELGPIETRTGATRVAGSLNLRDLLDRLSLASATENAGKLVGAVRVHATKPTSYFSSVGFEQFTVISPYPSQTSAVFYGMMNQNGPGGRHSNTDMVRGPAIVRGNCYWSGTNQITLQLRACKIDGPSQLSATPTPPLTNDSFVMDGVVLFFDSGDPTVPPDDVPNWAQVFMPLIDGWTPMVSHTMDDVQNRLQHIEEILGYGDSTTYAPTIYGPKGLNTTVSERLGRFLDGDGTLKDFAFVTGEAPASAFYEGNGLGAFIPFGRTLSGDNIGSNGYSVVLTTFAEGITDPDTLRRVPAWFWISEKRPDGVWIKGRGLDQDQLDPRSYDYAGLTFKFALLAFGATSTPNIVL